MQDASTGPIPGQPIEPADPGGGMVSREPRQRWRLIVAREAGADPQTQRELAEAWEAALAAAGLPLARTGDERSRPRISFGAPLPTGMAADGELIDVVLTERWPAWRVREAIDPVVPRGWRLVEAGDVWLAGPPLAGRVAGADYRVVLDVDGADAALLARLREAATALLRARRVERRRRKGDGQVAYDLRPLLIDVAIVDGPPLAVHTRTRLHPELGSGRPEEVVGALGDVLGEELPIASMARQRLVLIDDLRHEEGP